MLWSNFLCIFPHRLSKYICIPYKLNSYYELITHLKFSLYFSFQEGERGIGEETY